MGEEKTGRQFIEELIYENINLYDENLRLIIENNRLREELKELKSLERWWRGEETKKTDRGYVN
jgi:regulator of replication initiation timing